MRFLVLLFVFFMFPIPSFALDCLSPEVVVFFGNGMFNSRLDAWSSKWALQRALIKNQIIPVGQGVGIAYNLNEAALVELLQVATQKSEEYGRSFFQWISNLSKAPGDFRSMAARIARSFDQARYLRDSDLKTQVDTYRSEVAAGRTVITVAHSQGNFYANSAWHLLNATKDTAGRLFIVSAAAPVNSIAGAGAYTTLSQDIVINAVRAVAGALPANATNSDSSFSGHEFVSQYLLGEQSGPKLLADIQETVARINEQFMGVGKETLSYQDESLWPFMRYACVLQNQSFKLSDAQCVALSALAKTYDWFGEEKSNRNLGSIIRWIDECEKGPWHNPSQVDFNECTLLGDLPSLIGGYVGRQALDFVTYSHPECQWQGQEVGRHVTSAVAQEARRLLQTPFRSKLTVE